MNICLYANPRRPGSTLIIKTIGDQGYGEAYSPFFANYIDGNDTQLKELTEQRDRLSNQLRYLTLPEEAARVRALRDSLTKQAKALRKELATARTLLAGIAEKQRKIAIEQQMMRGPAQVTREKGVRRNEER